MEWRVVVDGGQHRGIIRGPFESVEEAETEAARWNPASHIECRGVTPWRATKGRRPVVQIDVTFWDDGGFPIVLPSEVMLAWSWRGNHRIAAWKGEVVLGPAWEGGMLLTDDEVVDHQMVVGHRHTFDAVQVDGDRKGFAKAKVSEYANQCNYPAVPWPHAWASSRVG